MGFMSSLFVNFQFSDCKKVSSFLLYFLAFFLAVLILSVCRFVQGNLVAVGTHKGFVQIWDAAAGKKLSMLEGHTARVGKEWRSRGFSGVSPS